MHEQGSLTGRRRAFERSRCHADDHTASRETRQDVTRGECTRNRVELMAALDQPRSAGRIDIGAKSNDKYVGLEGAAVSRHLLGHRIHRPDRRLLEANTGPDHVAVPMDDVVRAHPAEHHVELRETEDEPVSLVDQHHVNVLAEPFRQQGREFQPAETGSEDHNPHARTLPSALPASAGCDTRTGAAGSSSGWTRRIRPSATKHGPLVTVELSQVLRRLRRSVPVDFSAGSPSYLSRSSNPRHLQMLKAELDVRSDRVSDDPNPGDLPVPKPSAPHAEDHVIRTVGSGR